MESIGSGKHQLTSAPEVSTGLNDGPGNRAETLGRLTLSFPGTRARIALLEAQETRDGLVDEAMKEGNMVDWMPNISDN